MEPLISNFIERMTSNGLPPVPQFLPGRRMRSGGVRIEIRSRGEGFDVYRFEAAEPEAGRRNPDDLAGYHNAAPAYFDDLTGLQGKSALRHQASAGNVADADLDPFVAIAHLRLDERGLPLSTGLKTGHGEITFHRRD